MFFSMIQTKMNKTDMLCYNTRTKAVMYGTAQEAIDEELTKFV